MIQRRDLRVGDPERHSAITMLGEHLTSGRLAVDEYDERCRVIAAARVASDITGVFEDLPPPHPQRREPASGTGASRVVLGVCAAGLLVLLSVVAKPLLLVALPAAAVGFLILRARR